MPVRAEDAPRRVGSLNYISGEVAYALRGEAGEPGVSDPLSWSEADFNQPVCQDMSLKTGAMARARVRIGPDAIQMSSDTWLNMLNLSDQLIEASVRYGRVHLELSKLDDGETVELEIPRGSLWLLQAGAYDIDTGSGAADQPTRIVVFEGKARFVGGQADVPIAAGEEVRVTGSYPAVVTTERAAAMAFTTTPASRSGAATTATAAVPPPPNAPDIVPPLVAPRPEASAQVGEPISASAGPAPTAAAEPAAGEPTSPTSTKGSEIAAGRSGSATPQSAPVSADAGRAPSDDFLLWVEKSDDQPQPASQSTRYVSPETTGSDALDRYGRWDTLPDSEPVWFPTSVPEDWAPYRFGHWDSIPPWGWTWIDDQPWGFAPFHYGRWINIDGRWGWVPGAVVSHPVYAPALVAFIDTPDDAGSGSDGGPDVGWFPLGPDDDYSPWYQAGPDYVESVNAAGHRRFHDLRAHGYGEHGGQIWRGRYFNRRFATVVSRGAFADGRRVDREMMRRVPADRLEHAAVMRGAPRVTPAAMRTMAGPGEFRGGLRAMPAAAGPGGLGREPGRIGPAAMREPEPGRATRGNTSGRGAAAVGGPQGRGLEQSRQENGRSELGRNPAQGYRGVQQAGRPQVFQNSAQGYRGGAQQFGRPQVAQGYRGGVQQFGRPQIAQGYRGGVQQFGRPQMFQTPGASYRGAGMMGRSVPQMAARPAAVHLGGGGGGRHK
ncbi:MAG TPA: DUF6600 domain-containing protein [Stellaceae bacterium]|jgi:hypothetical protein